MDLTKLPIDDGGTIQFEDGWCDMRDQCRSCRMPPLTLDVVAKKLQNEMKFTIDLDVSRVAKLYTRFFDAVTSTTRELS